MIKRHTFFLFFLFANTVSLQAQNYSAIDSLLRSGLYAEAKYFYENNIYNANNQDSMYYFYQIKINEIYASLEQVNKADSLLKFIEPTFSTYPNHSFLKNFYRYEKGVVSLKQRKMIEALQLFEQTEPAFTAYPELYVPLQVNKNILFIQTGRIAEAEKGLFDIKKYIENQRFKHYSIFYPKVFTLLANVFLMKNNVVEAEKYYNKALSTLAENFSKSSLDYASTTYNIANLYLLTGRYEQAEKKALEAIPLFEQNTGKNSTLYAYCLSILGRSYYLGNKETEAEPMLKKAIAAFEKTVGTKHPDYASMLGSLANLYKKTKRYEESEAYFLKSKAILEGSKQVNYYITLGNLAMVYAATSQHEKASTFFETVLTEGEPFLGKNSSNYASFKYAWASMLTEQGKYEQAFEAFREANTIQKYYLSNYLNFLSEDERVDYYQSVESNFEAFNMLAMAYPKPEVLKELLELRLYSKGILLNENQRIVKTLLNTDNQQVKSDYEAFFTLKKQLAKLYALSPMQLATAKINLTDLEEKTNVLESKLVQASRDFSDWQSSQKQTAETVFANLKEDETAIEIIRFNAYLNGEITDKIFYNYLIINNKNNILSCKLVTKKNGKSLENAQYENYYLEATKRNGNVSLMKELGEIYWGNINAELAATKKIYLSLDGIYHKINLETLQNKEDKYFGELYDFVVLTNLKEIADNQSLTIPKQPTAVLIGNPAYDLENLKQYDLPEGWADTETRSFELKPNPFTQKEVTAIDKILNRSNWKSSLYVKKDAKEEVLKNLDFSPTVLHIASHGFYVEKNKNSSNFALGNAKNPLLHSMLFLSGAQNSLLNKKIGEEDGIFTAYEMSNLNLRQTQLVVLSACHTGLGKIKNGEGVYGLQRAIKSAGAKSLIISLWEVDDKATQELMVHFYTFWTQGNDLHDAFKKAQMKVKEKYPQPFYWGGFMLIGR